VIGADGGGRRLVRAESAYSVDWSPDGHRLVYDTSAGLFTCTAYGDSVTEIYAGVAYYPSWSPTGDHIAYDDMTHVWTIPLGGGTPLCLTTSLGGGRDPGWSPGGSALVILAGLSPGGEVATISSAGTLLGRVTADSYEDRAPAWSPSGHQIAWNRWITGEDGKAHPQFWIADTSGTGARMLVAGEGYITWSPDGSRLAFSKVTGSGSKLFTVRADGSAVKQITP
jgi:Tol biopolymer transport system component